MVAEIHFFAALESPLVVHTCRHIGAGQLDTWIRSEGTETRADVSYLLQVGLTSSHFTRRVLQVKQPPLVLECLQWDERRPTTCSYSTAMCTEELTITHQRLTLSGLAFSGLVINLKIGSISSNRRHDLEMGTAVRESCQLLQQTLLSR